MKIFIDDERMPLNEEIGDWVIARDPTTAFGLLNANAPFITHLNHAISKEETRLGSKWSRLGVWSVQGGEGRT